jgi:hypothetical protein
MAHGRTGPAPQTTKREQFTRLIASGVPNAEACLMVGVNRRTGTRCRFGRSVTSSSGRTLHYPAVINTRKREISPRYLAEDERVRIADLDRQGLGVRAIAGELGRSPATVSRELRRNRASDSGEYRPFTAQRLAEARRGARDDLPGDLPTRAGWAAAGPTKGAADWPAAAQAAPSAWCPSGRVVGRDDDARPAAGRGP